MKTRCYHLAAAYEHHTNALNQRQFKSFTSDISGLTLPILGKGPVASAGLAGAELELDLLKPDAHQSASFRNFRSAQ